MLYLEKDALNWTTRLEAPVFLADLPDRSRPLLNTMVARLCVSAVELLEAVASDVVVSLLLASDEDDSPPLLLLLLELEWSLWLWLLTLRASWLFAFCCCCCWGGCCSPLLLWPLLVLLELWFVSESMNMLCWFGVVSGLVEEVD